MKYSYQLKYYQRFRFCYSCSYILIHINYLFLQLSRSMSTTKLVVFLELIKFITEPDSYKFPSDYSSLIETIILSDYLCFIRYTEKRLQVPLGSIEPSNIRYQKLRQIIRGSYKVYNDHFVEYQNIFCGNCCAKVLLPDPPELIFKTCCNIHLCLKCATENKCPKCLNGVRANLQNTNLILNYFQTFYNSQIQHKYSLLIYKNQ